MLTNLINFDYSQKSSFTAMSSEQAKGGNATVSSINTGAGSKKQNLNDFLIEDEPYFGGQSMIRKQSSHDGDDVGNSQNINLSEYLEQAYDRFDVNPDHKIEFQDEDEDFKME